MTKLNLREDLVATGYADGVPEIKRPVNAQDTRDAVRAGIATRAAGQVVLRNVGIDGDDLEDYAEVVADALAEQMPDGIAGADAMLVQLYVGQAMQQRAIDELLSMIHPMARPAGLLAAQRAMGYASVAMTINNVDTDHQDAHVDAIDVTLDAMDAAGDFNAWTDTDSRDQASYGVTYATDPDPVGQAKYEQVRAKLLSSGMPPAVRDELLGLLDASARTVGLRVLTEATKVKLDADAVKVDAVRGTIDPDGGPMAEQIADQIIAAMTARGISPTMSRADLVASITAQGTKSGMIVIPME